VEAILAARIKTKRFFGLAVKFMLRSPAGLWLFFVIRGLRAVSPTVLLTVLVEIVDDMRLQLPALVLKSERVEK